MKRFGLSLGLLILALSFSATVSAQTFAGGASDKAGAQLETLTKKIDEQNSKIDALSQQMLKLEQLVANIRPGVMIGESAPSSAPAPSTPVPAAAGGNAHVVTKGETLTSIAKANRVGVQELQKFNHIENDRGLQIGQTIMIPSAGASPAATAAPNE